MIDMTPLKKEQMNKKEIPQDQVEQVTEKYLEKGAERAFRAGKLAERELNIILDYVERGKQLRSYIPKLAEFEKRTFELHKRHQKELLLTKGKRELAEFEQKFEREIKELAEEIDNLFFEYDAEFSKRGNDQLCGILRKLKDCGFVKPEDIETELSLIEQLSERKQGQLMIPGLETQNLTGIIDRIKAGRRARPDIHLDKNLVEIPIAIYDRKTKEHYVTFESGRGKTEIGSMYGCLTAFDEKVLKIGIMGYAFTIPELDYVVSVFSYSQLRAILRENVSTKRLRESLKKVGNTVLNFEGFIVNADTGKEIRVLMGAPLIQWHYLVESGEKGKSIFLFNPILKTNWLRYYHKINIADYRKIESPIARKIFEYITHKLTSNFSYAEHWEKLCDKIPITGKQKVKRLKTLLKRLKVLPKYGIEYAPKRYDLIQKGNGILRFKRTPKFSAYRQPMEETSNLEKELDYVLGRLRQHQILAETLEARKSFFLSSYPDMVELAKHEGFDLSFLRRLREKIDKERIEPLLFSPDQIVEENGA